MHSFKRIWALVLAAALLCTLLSGCGMVLDHEELKVIAVVSKGDDTAFWRAVLAGAEDAAIENGYVITFRGTETMGPESIQKQKDVLQLALDNGAVGVVMAAVGEGFVDQLTEIDARGLPVIAFDSGIWQSDLAVLKKRKCSPVKASVYTKNQEAGAMAAEHLYEHEWRKIAASQGTYVVGILQHDLSTCGADRSAGFEARFRELADTNPETKGKYRIQKIIRTGGINHNYGKAMGHLSEEGVDAVFMTSGDVVEQVAEDIRKDMSLYRDVVFLGFDAGDRQLSWMRSDDMPLLLGSVTQDAYMVGYKAVTQCVNAMEARGVTAFVEIPGIWYDRENLDELSQNNLLEEG